MKNSTVRQKERKTHQLPWKKKIVLWYFSGSDRSRTCRHGCSQSRQRKPLNYSLEFKGGTATTVAFDKDDMSIEEIDETDRTGSIAEVTGDANVQTQKVADSNSRLLSRPEH